MNIMLANASNADTIRDLRDSFIGPGFLFFTNFNPIQSQIHGDVPIAVAVVDPINKIELPFLAWLFSQAILLSGGNLTMVPFDGL